MDLSTRLMGITGVCEVYSQEPRIEVGFLGLNFNISKLVYCVRFFSHLITEQLPIRHCQLNASESNCV